MTCLNMTLSALLSNASSLPFAEADSMISTGTLMLWEPGHPANRFSGGAIAQTASGTNYTASTSMPNIAQRGALVATAPTSYTATASFATNVMTVTAVSGGTIQEGDDVYTAGGVLIGRITGFDGGTGGTGAYKIWPAPGTIASASVTITPSVTPSIMRNKPQSGGVDVDFKYEWTTKGGLHVVSSQSTQTSFAFFTLKLPSAVKTYMAANPSHSYYLSAWYNITRVALDGFTGPYIGIQSSFGATNGFFSAKTSGYNPVPAYTSFPVGARNTAGMCVEQMGGVYQGTALTNGTNTFLPHAFGFGLLVEAYGDYGVNKSMSAVLYRIFLEDLTLSGRTFAAVKALDDAAYTTAFGSGGRYNGDRYTAPGTLLP